jgi:hypothetical protein
MPAVSLADDVDFGIKLTLNRHANHAKRKYNEAQQEAEHAGRGMWATWCVTQGTKGRV